MTQTTIESQRNRIKAILDRGESLDPLSAMMQGCGMKASTRISELIDEGYPIVKSWKVVTNRYGKTVRIREYRKG